jgi:uncharacterized membrane protein YecN with MAPEG domain
MSVLVITTLSAVYLSVLGIMLSFRVIRIRRKEKIAVGDGGNEELMRAMRAQANLLEYSPLALILMACAEFNGVPLLVVAVLALLFVMGRTIHPAGMMGTSAFSARVRGMQMTILSMIGLSVVNVAWLLYLLVRHFVAS